MEFQRKAYLDCLIKRKHNRLVKVITGVRRCGKSYLMNTLFKRHLLQCGVSEDHIIEMSFDLFRNVAYREPQMFFEWVTAQFKDDRMYYLLLDEVQLLGEFVSVLNDFAARENCDVYATGSNAKFLSKDIATEFGGRSIELQMYPLSFSEFMSVYPGNELAGWYEYATYGGIPLVALAADSVDKERLLQGLFQETYLSDIVQRYKIRNVGELDALLNVLSSSIGALTNPHKLQRTFKSREQSKITAATITKYIGYLRDSFLLEEVRRYDIKGKAYIGTPVKYYFSDLGLRNARLDFRQNEPSHIMENVLFNELSLRGYRVDIGNIPMIERDKNGVQVRKQLEIDFICTKNSRKFYIQSAYSLEGEGKYEQEMRPLLKVQDANTKVIITFNTLKSYYTDEGIYIMNLFDFLRQSDALETL